MTGKHINKSQIKLFMELRNQQNTQVLAAAKTGISLRSAQRLEANLESPLKSIAHNKHNLKDPFKDIWESILVPLLEKNPKLQAITLLRYAQDFDPEKYPDNLLRTLQRRVQHWKAIHGPEKEIMFLQNHPPGWQGLSDFTDCRELRVVLAGEPFPHLIYHFWLPFSTWEYTFVITGGESYPALAEGLQGALWALGGVPSTHRTDSLSAAYKNLSKEASQDFTKAYHDFCQHYSMEPTRNNKGVKHENGSVETSHRHLKSRLDQTLMIRGNRDFTTIEEYRIFVNDIASRHNKGILYLLEEERKFLKPLPNIKTRDFDVEFVRVSSSSIITVRQVRYSVPSRLIGMQLKVHIYDDLLECFLGSTHVNTLKRLRWNKGSRPRLIDYRHLVESLSRKPQAFRRYIFRDELYPTNIFKSAWEILDKELDQRSACSNYVGLLKLSTEYGEEFISKLLNKLIDEGKIPRVTELKELLPQKPQSRVRVEVDSREPKSYEELLITSTGEIQ